MCEIVRGRVMGDLPHTLPPLPTQIQDDTVILIGVVLVPTKAAANPTASGPGLVLGASTRPLPAAVSAAAAGLMLGATTKPASGLVLGGATRLAPSAAASGSASLAAPIASPQHVGGISRGAAGGAMASSTILDLSGMPPSSSPSSAQPSRSLASALPTASVAAAAAVDKVTSLSMAPPPSPGLASSLSAVATAAANVLDSAAVAAAISAAEPSRWAVSEPASEGAEGAHTLSGSAAHDISLPDGVGKSVDGLTADASLLTAGAGAPDGKVGVAALMDDATATPPAPRSGMVAGRGSGIPATASAVKMSPAAAATAAAKAAATSAAATPQGPPPPPPPPQDPPSSQGPDEEVAALLSGSNLDAGAQARLMALLEARAAAAAEAAVARAVAQNPKP